MAELLKDKMTAETVNLLMKYLEAHSQTFEVSVSVQNNNIIIIIIHHKIYK